MREESDHEVPTEYKELPRYVRAFQCRLAREDVKALADIIHSYRRASTIGWFLKWLVTAMVGTFMAAVTFGESIKKFISMASG